MISHSVAQKSPGIPNLYRSATQIWYHLDLPTFNFGEIDRDKRFCKRYSEDPAFREKTLKAGRSYKLRNLEKIRDYQDRYKSENLEKRREIRRNKVRSLRSFISKLKESLPCKDCGKFFPAVCMDFDHIKGIKTMDVSKLVSRGSEEKISEEIAKCELVCANCHRLRTEERRKNVSKDIIDSPVLGTG